LVTAALVAVIGVLADRINADSFFLYFHFKFFSQIRRFQSREGL